MLKPFAGASAPRAPAAINEMFRTPAGTVKVWVAPVYSKVRSQLTPTKVQPDGHGSAIAGAASMIATPEPITNANASDAALNLDRKLLINLLLKPVPMFGSLGFEVAIE